MNITKAMVMSAGLGSRLEPLTLLVPKPLVPICNRPIMDILFTKLANIGINDVICNTYYLSEQIINRYKINYLGINFNYITEETLSGTAGGLKKCQYFFNEGEDFIVLSADGLTNADIKKGIEIHKKSSAVATIGIKRIPQKNVSDFGVVVTDKNGFVTEFQEKPSVDDAKSNFINTGIYIFNYKIFDFIPKDTFYDFAKDVFPKLLPIKQINTFIVNEYWSDIGTLSQYQTSIQDVFNGKCQFKHDKIIKTKNGAYICPDNIEAEFTGYCVIGRNCKFGKNVVINNSIIWDNVTIANNVTIKNCIIASDEIIACDKINQVIGKNKIISLS